MEKEINGIKYQLKELTYLQALSLEGKSTHEVAKEMLKLSTGLSEEELEKLSLKDGMELQKAINELNKLDFRNPVGELNPK